MFKNPCIIFIISSKSNLENYTPLSEPLVNRGLCVKYISIGKFFSNYYVPDEKYIKQFNIWCPEPTVKKEPKNKIEFYRIVNNELIPQWNEFLNNFGSGVVVVGQDGAVAHRLMLHSAKKHGLTTVAIQDGHFTGIPKAYAWELDAFHKKISKFVLYYSFYRKFLTLPFGTEADYLGLFGEIIKERIIKESGIQKEKIKIIGSVRHTILKQKIIKNNNDDLVFNILFLPATFSTYGNKKLHHSQDIAFQWLYEASTKLKMRYGLDLTINIKMKNGHDKQIDRYEKFFKNNILKILDSSLNMQNLLSNMNLVVVTVSTAALEAAICKIPVIQVAPPYLLKRVHFTAGLPLAKDFEELFELMTCVHSEKDFINKFILSAKNELADIDPSWDSIEEATDWLADLANSK